VNTWGVPSLQTIQPYVEQLLEDDDVRKHLSRSATNLRAAVQRVGDAKAQQRKSNTRLYLLLAVVTAAAAVAASKTRRP
jgi:hypothetical protein